MLHWLPLWEKVRAALSQSQPALANSTTVLQKGLQSLESPRQSRYTLSRLWPMEDPCQSRGKEYEGRRSRRKA